MSHEFQRKFKFYIKSRKHGLTQAGLANKLTVAEGTLSKYVNGSLYFPPKSLKSACTNLNLSEVETQELIALYNDFWEQKQLETRKPAKEEVVEGKVSLPRQEILGKTEVVSNNNVTSESPIDFDEAEAVYCDQVITAYKDLSFSGLGHLSLEDIPVEQIFVNLTLLIRKPDSSEAVDQKREKRRSQTETIEDRYEPIELAKALSKNAVIVGEPGSGKSTLLRWLAVTYAQKRQGTLKQVDSEIDQNRLPIFIRLGLLADYYLEPNSRVTPNWIEVLPKYISHQQYFPDLLSSVLGRALRQGRCLLLFDGLDEIVDQATRIRLVRSLAGMARHYPGNRLVISSRPSGVEQGMVLPQFQRCQIARFDPPQLQQFFRFWYTGDSHLPIDIGRRKADELYTRLQDAPKLLELATTPLIATILLLLWRAEEALPSSWVQLYERCCYTLIESWENEHDVPHDAIFNTLNWREHLAMLACLAYAIHKQEKSTHASYNYLTDRLADFFVEKRLTTDKSSAKKEAEKSLRILGLRSSLFQQIGDDQYGFLHQCFQEYLAARYIAEQPFPHYANLFLEDMHKDWWREVHVLTIAHLVSDAENSDKASHLILTILNHKQPFSRWLSKLDLASSEVFLHGPLFGRLLAFIRCSRFADKILLLSILSLWPLIFWEAFRAVLFYFCPTKWHIAQLLEREYILVVDGYLAADASLMTPRISKVLSDHAQLLLWRSIYTNAKLNEDVLPYIYLILREYFRENKKESEILIHKLVNVIEYSDYQRIQVAAIKALGHLKQTSHLAISTLLKQVDCQLEEADYNSDKDERIPQGRAAIAALGKLGVYSDTTVATLIRALKHEQLWIREAAARSLGQLEQTDSRIIDVLIDILQKGNETGEVCKATIESLARSGLVDPRILEELVKALGHTYSTVSQTAINELTHLVQSNLGILDILIDAVSQEWNWQLYESVSDCLVNAGKVKPEIINRLRFYLNHPSSSVKLVVTETLIELGNIDSSIEVILGALLTDTNPDLRRIAVEQTSKLEQVSERTAEILTQLLINDPESIVREGATWAIGNLRITSNAAIEGLISNLDDVTTLWHGSLSLHKFQKRHWQVDNEKLQKVSLDIVQDDYIISYSYHVAVAAAINLGYIGQTDDRVIHALVRALHNHDCRVREAAARSLGVLGVASEEVFSALKESLNDSYLDYRSGQYPVAMATAISLVNLGKPIDAQQRFAEFFQAHDDEINTYRDVQLAAALYVDADKNVLYSRADIRAIESLISSGVSEKDLAYYFIAALKDTNRNIRIAAASGLGELGYYDDTVVSALMKVAGENSRVSTEDLSWSTPASAAIESLGRLHIEDSRQLKRLIKFLERHRRSNRSSEVRYLAFNAIQNLMKEYPYSIYH